MNKGSKQNDFFSPLATQIRRFLEFKRAAGCRYLEEERLLYDIDRFLAKHIAFTDPVITMEIVRAYLRRKTGVSEATRGHWLSLIRQLCLFLSLEEPRTATLAPSIGRQPPKVLNNASQADLSSCSRGLTSTMQIFLHAGSAHVGDLFVHTRVPFTDLQPSIVHFERSKTLFLSSAKNQAAL